MDTYNQSQQKANQLEDFLDNLEQEEGAGDVPVSEIEAGEAAYQEYLAGRDSGKSYDNSKCKI
jgi:hypothetical protein